MANAGYRTGASFDLRLPVATEGATIGDLAREVFGELGSDSDPQPLHHRMTKMIGTCDPSSRVAVDESGTIFAASVVIRRGHLTGLSLLVVREAWQGQGVGRELLRGFPAAEPGRNRVILSSPDPKAMRRYSLLGLGLHPTVSAAGVLRPGTTEVPDGSVAVRPLDGAHVLDAIAREARGEPYGTADIEIWDAQGDTLHLFENQAAVIRGGGVLRVAVARTPEAGALAIRAALAAVPPGETVHIRHIRSGQDWVIREALRARLELSPEGPLFSDEPLGPLHLPTGTVF